MGTAMTDRADELARRVFENCTHGVSDYDAYGPCLRCTADALRAYAEEARREEREASAVLAEDWPAECLADAETNCGPGIAAAILARGEKKR